MCLSLKFDKNSSLLEPSIVLDIIFSSPSLGESIVPIKLRRVVLPPPDGPLIITNSPLYELD